MNRLSPRARRVIIRGVIAVDVAVLVMIAVGVRVVHQGPARTAGATAVLAIGALAGLYYLRTSKRGAR